jgi:hypothetical protein
MRKVRRAKSRVSGARTGPLRTGVRNAETNKRRCDEVRGTQGRASSTPTRFALDHPTLNGGLHSIFAGGDLGLQSRYTTVLKDVTFG